MIKVLLMNLLTLFLSSPFQRNSVNSIYIEIFDEVWNNIWVILPSHT